MSDELSWRKASYSDTGGNCVELAKLSNGEVAMRNSRHRDGAIIVYTPAEIAAFLAGAKAGEFDDMVV